MRGQFKKLNSIPIMTQNKLFLKAQKSVSEWLNESNVSEWLTLNKYGLKSDKIEYLEDVVRNLEHINPKLANYIKVKYS